jgi:hypothetical protein
MTDNKKGRSFRRALPCFARSRPHYRSDTASFSSLATLDKKNYAFARRAQAFLGSLRSPRKAKRQTE